MQSLARQEPGYGPPAPVQIYQWETEFTQLLDFYEERAPRRVLEIGTYHGGTLYHWLRRATPGACVVSVDSYATGIDNRALYGEWCPASVECVAIAGDSMEPLTVERVRQYGPFDWIWIDGGHFYREVRADWDNYGPMCRAGGVVCFHDILPPSEMWPSIEVSRLWEELVAEHATSEIVADRDADWGGIGLVYP